MNMMPLPQNYRPLSTPFQQTQQVDDILNGLLTQTDKRALIAKLNSGFFSQNTLHSLLYNAFLKESPDVVAMMLKTKSYACDVVATIIVDSLNNEQGVNQQEGFVVELLKDESVKVSLLTTALHIAARRGMNLNNDLPLIGKLIKLSTHVLSADEAAQIAHACSDISEFLLFVQLHSKNVEPLLANYPVINETDVIKKINQEEKKVVPLTLSTIPAKIQGDISQFLDIPDLLRLRQTSRDFNEVTQKALTIRTKSIRAPELTVETILTLRKVNCLDLFVPNATDAKMLRIGQLTNLHTLNLGGSALTDAGLHHLEKLTNLHTLYLYNTKVTDAGLHCLEKLTHLHTLNLSWTAVSGHGLQHLGKLIDLHTLDLVKTGLTDAGLHHLENLTHLHTLKLSGTNVSDAGLQYLEKLTHLHTLDLSWTAVSGYGLQHLGKLTHLHTLNLSRTNVSDAGLRHLEKLTDLHTLFLINTEVTDAGLHHLEKLTHLHTLVLVNTKVTNAGLPRLKNLLPNLIQLSTGRQ